MQPPGPFTVSTKALPERPLAHPVIIASWVQFQTFHRGNVVFDGRALTLNDANAFAWFIPGGQLWPRYQTL